MMKELELSLGLIILVLDAIMTANPLERHDKVPAEVRKVVGGSACTKLQQDVQAGILRHQWNLGNLKFQQRLKKSPKYIVTIQSIEPVHEPLVELRCPGGSGPQYKDSPNLEFYFHESRFQAASVRLFDISSIFPIHTGSMSVKIKLDPLVVALNKMNVGSIGGGNSRAVSPQLPGLNDVYYVPSTPGGNLDFAKEHRDASSGEGHTGNIGDPEYDILEVEKEIELIFTNRIKPDVQKQLRAIVYSIVRKFLTQNLPNRN